MNLRIALLQILPIENDVEANLKKGLDFCQMAARLNVDLILFPEMWSIGYGTFVNTQVGISDDLWKHPENISEPGEQNVIELRTEREEWLNLAVTQESAFVRSFCEIARDTKTAVGITYLEQRNDKFLNSMSLINQSGIISIQYSKVHTCCFSEPEASLSPGDSFEVCELETKDGPVKIGAMICFDREFPESARILMLKGAEILIVPNACELEMMRISQIRTRAFENMVGIAVCNYPHPKDNGHSIAFHPCAFGEDGKARETLLVEAGEKEGIIIADFDLDEIRNWRKKEVWADAFRRPDSYERLLSYSTEAVFERVNKQGRTFRQARKQ